jgi:DNA-binding transcriptional regulator YiaG
MARASRHHPEPDLQGRLRSFRERWNLTRSAAARRLGVAPTTWARWESGRAHPRGLILRAVLRMLQDNVPPGQMGLWE